MVPQQPVLYYLYPPKLVGFLKVSEKTQRPFTISREDFEAILESIYIRLQTIKSN